MIEQRDDPRRLYQGWWHHSDGGYVLRRIKFVVELTPELPEPSSPQQALRLERCQLVGASLP